MDTPPVIVKKTFANSLTKNSLTPCRRVGLGRPSSGSLKKLVQVRTISTPSYDSSLIENQSRPAVIPNNKPKVTPACGSPLKATFKLNDGQNKETTRVRRCLAQDLKANQLQSLKRTFKDTEVETGVSSNKRVNCDSIEEESNISNQVKKLKSDLTLPIIINSKPIIEGYESRNSLACKTKPINTLAGINNFENNKEISEEIILQLVWSLLEKQKKLEQLKVQETYEKKHNLKDLRAQTARWRSAGQEALRHCERLARQAGFSVTVHQLMVQHGFPVDLMGYNADDDEFE